MQRIYCGNNNNDPRLTNRTHVIGTKNQCMRKGIGRGLNLPYDVQYEVPYTPIDPRSFYCGNGRVVPNRYFADGSPSKCLQKGVGIGKATRVSRGRPWGMTFIRYYLPWVLFILIAGGIFTLFYITKPKCITKTRQDSDGNIKIIIDWKTFSIYYTLCCVNLALIIWWFWAMFVRKWI